HFLTNSSRSALPSGESAMASRRHEVGATFLSRTSAWNAQSFAYSRSGPIEALLQSSGLPRAPCQCGENSSMDDGEQSAPVATCHFLTNSVRSALPSGESAMASRRHEVGATPMSRSAWNAQSFAFSRSGPIEALLQYSGLPR